MRGEKQNESSEARSRDFALQTRAGGPGRSSSHCRKRLRGVALPALRERRHTGSALSGRVRRQSGLEIRLRDVPLLPETVALSEALGKNPYRMDTEALLFLTESGDSLARSLRAKDIPAACIGRFVPGLDKCVVDKTEREYINRPERGIELEAEVFETERKTDA